jgi:DNA-binding CsgD family transcriptional regulator
MRRKGRRDRPPSGGQVRYGPIGEPSERTKRGTMIKATTSHAYRAEDKRHCLTERESQVLSLLAAGQSGAEIAAELVLSPETVRTHVRNAMSKLGASTRSHAVALALQRGEIGGDTAGVPAERHSRPDHLGAETAAALEQMLGGLVTLYDVEGGGVYLSEEDALSLRRVAVTETPGLELPALVALGDGILGRAALERRPQLSHENDGCPRGTLIAAPIMGGGRLLGVIALGARGSRPISRSEQLLLQTLSNRVGEVLAMGGDVTRPLARAMEQFRASWSAARRNP